MIADLGEVLVIIALIASFLQAIAVLLPKIHQKIAIHIQPDNLVKFTTNVTSASLIISFICLVYSYVTSDFSLVNVFRNSHTDKPLIYKITGTWGNHEGSMLLFACILGAFNMAFLRFGSAKYKYEILAAQGAITFGILCFILFTSNPFTRMELVPDNGMGLNPLLQDIGLALHPPMLYLGYVGFSLALSSAVTGLLRGEIDRIWARSLKPWVVTSWAFLTLGIGLGSWWAYRELGWGGFWFWDPVENSSLLPWLAGTTLLHCLLVLEKRDTLKGWAAMLAILTFCLSLAGFFLVRSGVLTSVHAFASDPTRGIFMLVLLAIIAGVSLTIFGLKAHALRSTDNFSAFSKESGILINNLLLMTLCATIFLGTLYPIFLQVLDSGMVSVGAPYFNAIFLPIAFALLFLMAIAPFLRWKSDRMRSLAPKIIIFAVIMVAMVFIENRLTADVFGLALGMFLLVTIFMEFARRTGLFRTPLAKSLKKARTLPPGFYSMAIAHSGVAVMAIAISLLAAWKMETELLMQPGESTRLGKYKVEFIGTKVEKGANYLARRGKFRVWRGLKELAVLHPESRIYLAQGTHTTEAAIHSTPTRDIYIVIGDRMESMSGEDGRGFSVRIFIKPYMNYIWLGCILMAVGGGMSVIEVTRRR